MNVDLSFELQNFKAEFTQQFAVMRRVPKVPSVQRGFAALFKCLILLGRYKTPLPVNSGEGPQSAILESSWTKEERRWAEEERVLVYIVVTNCH